MFANINGTRLAYELEGQGRPVLMLHGIGFDQHILRPWLDQLADQAQLIYYDQRGHGRSSRPDSFAGISHQTWVDDADALRAQLGHERVVVFGHSYGGFLAQEYALRYPERVVGLVLCSTAPVVDYPELIMANAASRATPEQLAAVQQAFGRPMRDDADWQATWRTMLPIYFKHYDPALGALLDRRMRYSAAAYNHANAALLPGFNTLPELGRIHAPTLVLGGRHDWITPPEQGARRLAAAIPGAQCVIFEQSGHFPYIEEPAAFLDTVGAWLARL